MKEEQKKVKISKFLADESMSDTVYLAIRDSFLKKRGVKDVQVLAAERLAVDLLEDAWKELERYATEVEIATTTRVGHV